jgi:collagenase-like PrtC family protease
MEMKLALGPILYYWPGDAVRAFYEEAASWPVDCVYLGETVCSRRHLLRLDDWLEVAAMLRAAGKQVVLSTLTMTESESDLKAMRRLIDAAGDGDDGGNGSFSIEANDMGAVRLLHERGLPFVAGATLNVYNPATLAWLIKLGATRWVAPLEMSGADLSALLAGIDARPEARPEVEVFAYGKLPLAYSARCFTARHHDLPKDDCQFRCLDYPDGLTMSTREGTAFLSLNGIQTQSAGVYSLLHETAALRSAGVNWLRISPQSQRTGQVARLFRDALDGATVEDAALRRLMPGPPCDGYWHARAGMEYSQAREAVKDSSSTANPDVIPAHAGIQ